MLGCPDRVCSSGSTGSNALAELFVERRPRLFCIVQKAATGRLRHQNMWSLYGMHVRSDGSP